LFRSIFTKKNPFSKQKYQYLLKEAEVHLLVPLKIIALLVGVYSLFALIFEVRYHSEFSFQIFLIRLSAAIAAFLALVLLYTKFGSKRPILLVHSLLTIIIISSGYMSYLIPSTLLVNVQIISLLIFTSALFLSWEVKNQIIVSIYYIIVFAAAILLNGKSIYYLNNIYETVLFVLFLSLISVVGSSVNFRLRLEIAEKSYAVRQSEKKFRSIFDNSTEGIFQTSHDGRIIVANPAFVKILGYNNLDELFGLNIDQDIFINSEDRDKLIKQLRRENFVHNYKVGLKKKDGTAIIVKLDDRLLRDEAGEIYFEGTIRDVTEQIQLEAERKKAEVALKEEKRKSDQLAKDALNASSIKSRFLADMSHELRTPVNGLLGLLNLIETDSYKNKEELKQFVADAKISAELLLNIINNILDISKIESGTMELQETAFDLAAVLNESVSIIKNKAHEKGLKIFTDIAEDVPIKVIGDGVRIKQIFINLLGNAIKFTEKGMISARIKLKEKSEELVSISASVEDTGCGIAKHEKENIFKRYSQIGESSDLKQSGTGLGLTICREFIFMMGGEISVESEEKKGSKFIFTINLKPQKILEQLPEENDAKNMYELQEPQILINNSPSEFLKNQRSNFKILLAEDNQINQKVAIKILNTAGYSVDAVCNGREAVQAVKNGCYSLVLMDIQMPELDGYNATKEIREIQNEISKIPIIAITAHALRGDKERCLSAGMNDYISKPIIAAQLICLLDKWANINNVQSTKKPETDIPGSDIFDFEHFEKISIGDKEFQRELLESYFTDVEERIQKLENFITLKDIQHTINEAHTIKGASLSIGALKVGEHALAVEISGKNNDIARASDKLIDLKKAFEATRDALKKNMELWV
jgi:PAS domain S-box-containing protein